MCPLPSSSDERTASPTERALRLLLTIAAEGRALSLAVLSERLDLPKATTHRLCASLVAAGWLVRDTDEKRFALGVSSRQFALDALTRGEQRALRHAVLQGLVDTLGETCNFTVLDGAEVVYLDRVEARWPLRLTLEVGSRVPLHCTASGKLFLATLAPLQRDALLERLLLTRSTPQTLVEPSVLRVECERIAQQGYSIDNEEFMAGLLAIAVPVRDARGEVRAALAAHAPSARMPLDLAMRHLPVLQSAADELAALL